MMEKLKPCPFDGEDAIMETFAVAGEKTPRYRVRCQACWCETDWDNYSVDDAAKTWNRRAQP